MEDVIFLIKDLRNAVAHNSVIFDCRFKKADPPSKVTEYLQTQTTISNITFNHIVDYFIILVVLLRKVGVTRTEC
ncbi:hypothetical protein [Salibacterium lacus]|uniref:Abi-like protein n=1 Tax=Salibacterium lacus TaxID=1898109 RepID=A0ABW5T604_9BACI